MATNCLVTIGSALALIAGFITETKPMTPTLTMTTKTICSIKVMPRWAAVLVNMPSLRLDCDGQGGIKSRKTDHRSSVGTPAGIKDNVAGQGCKAGIARCPNNQRIPVWTCQPSPCGAISRAVG